MLHRTLPGLLLLLGLGVTVSCSSSEGLSGVWAGTTVSSIVFTITLTETEAGQVTGAGRVNIPSGLGGTSVFPLTMTGAHAHPALSLHIQPTGLQSMNFSGLLQTGLGRIDGVLNGSGFFGDSLRLSRVPLGTAGQLTAP